MERWGFPGVLQLSPARLGLLLCCAQTVCRTRDLKYVSLCFDPTSPASPQLVDCACCCRQCRASGCCCSGQLKGIPATERWLKHPLALMQARGTEATLRLNMEQSVLDF